MKANYLKFAIAVALLFAVNMNADAQFGKLKKLANKAKEAVVEKVEQNTDVSNPITEGNVNVDDYSSSSSDNTFTTPEMTEINGTKAAGGLDKYLGLTEGDEALVYSYYKPGESDFRTDGKYDCGKTYGNMIAQKIVDIYRYLKSDGKLSLANADPGILRDFYYGKPKGAALVTGRPDLNDWLEHAQTPRSKYDSLRKGEQNVLMSKADADAFKRAAEKAKKVYEAKFGVIPKE